MLETRQTQDGPWQLKFSQMSSDLQLTTSSSSDFNTEVKEPFLTKLINNIQDRFVDTYIIDQLSVLDLSGTPDELQALYGFNEMFSIADHFSMDPEELQTQWQDFIQLLNTLTAQDRSMTKLLQLLHNSTVTGLKDIYHLVL
ncbi:Hypothetical predicted protein [Mytilus galloprovincialis]|uniref:Uncharacterized protein n=1 Tax=Mytilus galloprovincialis TaxID=29158 RepID=A0A8B6G440_MYTGA|nr:Hypothetical predicted protein [Mytilus galloprovincialis]